MREKTLYARLAWTGMRKNRRLYLPYLLSCAGMYAEAQPVYG